LLIFLPTYDSLESENDEITPYIYYHSIYENAFIIERADSTDRHVFVRFEIPDPLNATGAGYIVGPGWSSSGTWFVWSHWRSNGAPSEDMFIIRNDGTEYRRVDISTLISEFSRRIYVVEMRWHPNQDILLVYLHRFDEEQNATIILYDPEQDAIRLNIDFYTVFNSVPNVERIFWLNEGNSFVLWADPIIYILDNQGATLKLYRYNIIKNIRELFFNLYS